MIIDGIEYVEKMNMDVVTTKDRDFSSLIGCNYFFRTVTYHTVGKVVGVYNNFIKIEDSSFIPDTPRFMNFIKDGDLDEVEPTGTCWINIDSVTDFFPWKHALPSVQK
mgnify:CR=1 FL=1|tara:strand:+ start:737 stop:1060 length:324 start_codon:yes stop_codon:yes gene_type:complete